MCELLKAFAVVVVGLCERLDSKRQTLWKYVDTCSSMHTSLLTEYSSTWACSSVGEKKVFRQHSGVANLLAANLVKLCLQSAYTTFTTQPVAFVVVLQ